MLNNMNVNKFIEELASNSPAPGGGSVAALSAALGCALNSMVFNLTVGKKMYKEYSKEVQITIDNSLENSIKKMTEFIELMEKDTKVFMELMNSYKLPKNSDEEKKIRIEKINEASEKVLQVPFDIAKKVYDIYEDIIIACKYGNKNAISDAGVSAIMMQSALESSILNVKINLSSMKDESRKKEINDFCNELIIKGRKKRDCILEQVNKIIG